MIGTWKDRKYNLVANRVVGWLLEAEEDPSELESLDYSFFIPSTTRSGYN